jgi:hypothetical protein
VHLRVKEDTSNRFFFLHFLVYLLESDDLIADDFLILNNAKIYTVSDIFTVVYALCDAASVHIFFMPFYSHL